MANALIRNKKKIHPSRDLFIAKLFYLIFYAAVGSYVVFFNVYLQGKGFNGTQIGWLGSLPPLISLVASPFWSSLADRFQKHRAIAAGCAFFAGILSLMLLSANQYWLLLILIGLLFFFRDPLIAYIDSSVMNILAHHEGSYGRQRLWGSIGFIITSFGLGLIISESDLTPIFWLQAALLSVGCTALALLLPPISRGGSVNLHQGFIKLAKDRKVILFLLANMIFGIGVTSFLNFLGLHILALNGTESQVGLAFAMKAILEIPVMYAGARWFRRFSYGRLLQIGLIGFAIIWGMMIVATNPIQIIVIITGMGIVYAIYWVAAVGYADKMAPPGLNTTAQSFVIASHYGLGGSLGAIIGGYIWDYSSGHFILAFATGTAVFAALINWWNNKLLSHKDTEKFPSAALCLCVYSLMNLSSYQRCEPHMNCAVMVIHSGKSASHMYSNICFIMPQS
jgi:MFS transporter, PPP family, 3-phenylpropionic acid transporter